VRQQLGGNLDVKINDLALGETGFGIEYFVEV
jgi:hypothetical protein